MSEDSKEHVVLAKGKEIKRSKEEGRAICLAYINEFTKENPDQSFKRGIIEDYSKESFWQKIGLVRADRERPLYSIGADRLLEANTNLKKTLDKS